MSTTFPGSEYLERIIDGRFRLLRWLGGTEHSSVFLTELAGDPPREAAIKFVAADDPRGAHWDVAINLSHPDLIRMFAFGRCELDEFELRYVVMEYAEEVLSEILAERSLTPAETAEMLPAIVDALEYLHAEGLVHGGLTPANVMAAGDRLKISVDGLATAGDRVKRPRPSSDYEAPEMATEDMAPAMDVWSLGAVLVKALTPQTPAWHPAGGGEPVVPASVSEPFASIARECLQVDPASRCTLEDIRARLEPAPNGTPAPEPIAVPALIPAPVPVPAAAPVPVPSGQIAQKEGSRLSGKVADLTRATDLLYRDSGFRETRRKAALLITAIVILAVVVIAAIVFRSHRTPARTDAETKSSVAAPAVPESQRPVAEGSAREGPAANRAVIRRVMPEVPHVAMATIRGHVRVGIRVQVDANGDVSNAAIDSQGPSRYFAQFALDAARGWKFRPAASSTWTLQFVFTQDGVEVTPMEMGS